MVVTASYTTPPYAGSSLTLTCTVTLDPNVDNDENVTASWSGPSDISGERYLISVASGSGSTYTSNLTISSLVDQDNGTYIHLYWNSHRRERTTGHSQRQPYSLHIT